MKTIAFLCALPLLFWGCDAKNKVKYVYLRSYITCYYENDLVMWMRTRTVKESGKTKTDYYLCCTEYEGGGAKNYFSPDFGTTGKEAEKYMELAERNGDLSYNRMEPYDMESPNRRCWADNFKAMHVKCLNASWSDRYPAGSLLDDLVQVEFRSYADYIRRGYPEGDRGIKDCKIRISELKETDLSMISGGFSIYFSVLPPAGSYEMEVTFVTTEGEEKTATCTLAIE